MNLSRNRRNLIIVFGMLLIASIIFGLALIERLPNLGDLMANDCRLTFDTSTFLYNWIDSGLFNVKGKMYMAPSSIETPGGAQLYTSYPPGFMVFPYILCLITGNEGTVSLVQAWNLFNHYLLALLISLIIFFIYKKTKFANEYISALIGVFGGVITIFVPGLYYYMQFEYFSDMAAFVPMAALILTEILLEDAQGKTKKALYWIQAFFIFAAAFTDFVCYFMIFIIWSVRIARGRYKSFKNFVIGTLTYVWPMLLAILLFALYLLAAAGGVESFLSRYTQRASFNIDILWIKKIGYWLLSFMGIKLLLLLTATSLLFGLMSIVGVLLNKRDKSIGKVIGWGMITLLPMVMVTAVLSEHAFYHDFPMLRFIFPLVILPLAVCPILLSKIILSVAHLNEKKTKSVNNAILSVILIIAVLSAAVAYVERNSYLEPRLGYKFDFEPQNFLYGQVEYEDYVYITPEQLDIAYPAVYARKPMHSLCKPETLPERVEALPGEANICVLYVKNPEKPLSETTDEIKYIMSQMELEYEDEDYEFYRCAKSRFLEILDELGNSLGD